ncbi:MAG: hypothetical protein AB1589_22810 [Cyanobacteriota bacterium]
MEIKLGLCKLPEPIYLYVRNGEEGGNSYCWYYHNPDTKVNTPETSDGLCGHLSELRITAKEYKGKENIKLDIVISAGETYVIRSGIETNFSKSFLLAIALIEDLSKPLIIGCSAGKENVVFCNVYDAATKARVKAEWNASADWASIIDSVQSKLSGRTLVKPQTSRINRDSLKDQSDQMIKYLGWSESQGKEYLQKNYGKGGRSLLTDAELLDFVGKLQIMSIPS